MPPQRDRAEREPRREKKIERMRQRGEGDRKRKRTKLVEQVENSEWERRLEAARKALAGCTEKQRAVAQREASPSSEEVVRVSKKRRRRRLPKRGDATGSEDAVRTPRRHRRRKRSSSRSPESKSRSPSMSTPSPVPAPRSAADSWAGHAATPRCRSRSRSRAWGRVWQARGTDKRVCRDDIRKAVWQPVARRGKGAGKGGASAREFELSMALSRLLRHNAERQGLTIRADGYCTAKAILALPEFRRMECSLTDLQRIVANNDKQRFQLLAENGQIWIRAVQGHSMKSVSDGELLKPLSASDRDLPTLCVHGTYRKHMRSILQRGLIPGGGKSARNHVHFAPFAPGEGRVISGARNNAEILVYLDLRGALLGGVPFFVSANRVILTSGNSSGVVPPAHIFKIEEAKTGVVVYRRD